MYASQVVGQDFLALMGKSTLECQQEVSSGRFPPCIVYKIIYSSPEERRVKRALMTVDVDGANVPLSFHCLVKEEMRECVHSLWYMFVSLLCIHVVWEGRGEGCIFVSTFACVHIAWCTFTYVSPFVHSCFSQSSHLISRTYSLYWR